MPEASGLVPPPRPLFTAPPLRAAGIWLALHCPVLLYAINSCPPGVSPGVLAVQQSLLVRGRAERVEVVDDVAGHARVIARTCRGHRRCLSAPMVVPFVKRCGERGGDGVVYAAAIILLL